jgi:hypothetical protein
MSNVTVITIDHVRAVGLCVNGTRTWFARHDLDFRAFLQGGLDADTLLATGDAMPMRVVDYAQAQAPQHGIGEEKN